MVRCFNLESSPIVALATPPGISGVAVLRLSGPVGLLDLILPLLALQDGTPLTAAHLTPRTLRLVCFHETATSPPLDHLLVVHFPAPHSFTGEEVVELHTHGSPLVNARILELLYQQGIQAAKAGEFSLRACLNGKMDLVRAEALLQFLNANTLTVAREASRQLAGSLSTTLLAIRQRLLEALIQLEAQLDFADEEITPQDNEEITLLLSGVQAQLSQLLSTGALGRQMTEGFHLVIAGRPNVGKSSLFNQLVGHDKAIVTAIPGTTRDLNDATLTLDGLPIVLVDTAGIRESLDVVEQIGVDRARKRLTEADAALWVLDATTGLLPEDLAILATLPTRQGIVVWNKADLLEATWTPPPLPLIDWHTVVISCVTEEGLDSLRRAVGQLLAPMPKEGGGILMAERHRQGVTKAMAEIQLAMTVTQRSGPPELTSLHGRAALNALEEMVGLVSDQEVLNGIFQSFCIGK